MVANLKQSRMHTLSKKEETQAVTQRALNESAGGQDQDLSLRLAQMRVSRMVVKTEGTTETAPEGKSSIDLLQKRQSR